MVAPSRVDIKGIVLFISSSHSAKGLLFFTPSKLWNSELIKLPEYLLVKKNRPSKIYFLF